MSTPSDSIWPSVWRRCSAFFIDWLVIGLLGISLTALAFDVFAGIGELARVLGFAVAVTYFGVMGSVIGGGRTLGKRLLSLRVVTDDGQPPSLQTAIGRAVIVSIPVAMNGVQFQVSSGLASVILTSLFTAGFLGLGVAQIFLLFASRPSRRLVHDLLAKTAVVRMGTQPIWTPTKPAHIRWAAGLGLGLCLIPAGASWLVTAGLGDSVTTMQKTFTAVGALPEVQSAAVLRSSRRLVTVKTGATRTDTLAVRVRLRAWPEDIEKESRRVMRTAAQSQLRMHPGETISVTLNYGVTLGIASAWRSHSRVYKPPFGSPHA